MAGHVMVEVLTQTGQYEVYGVARQAGENVDKVLDVTHFDLLEDYLDLIRPDYVINCVGVLVKQSKDNLPSAILLNSYLPNFLSKVGNKLNYKLIHISTDCVFSGKKGQYTESSYRDGDDSYARTKALGEVINDKDLTIRTSIIGPELKTNGTGLLDWFLKQEGSIKGYTKVYWSGVTTLELARSTVEFIKQNTTGLYQLCPNGKISKFNLLHAFTEVWEKELVIIPHNDCSVDKSLVCTRTDFLYPSPSFVKMLPELKAWMKEHLDYYSHYELIEK